MWVGDRDGVTLYTLPPAYPDVYTDVVIMFLCAPPLRMPPLRMRSPGVDVMHWVNHHLDQQLRLLIDNDLSEKKILFNEDYVLFSCDV